MDCKKINFYFSYMGNKRQELKHLNIINKDNLNNYSMVCEPFCGSSAFSYWLFRNGFNGKFLLNDHDKELIDFLKIAKEKGTSHFFEECHKRMTADDFTKDKHKEYIKANDEFRYFYWHKCYNYRKGLYPDPQHVKQPKCIYKHEDLDNFFMSNKITLTNKDYKDIFKKVKNKKGALVFLDPPYLDSYNGYYHSVDRTIKGEIQDTTQMYVDILDFMKTCKCSVILVLNNNALIKHLYKDFFKYEYNKSYNSTVAKSNRKNKTMHGVYAVNI